MNTQPFVLWANHPDREQVRANLSAFIDRLPATKSWRIEISEERPKRTDKQRRSLFGPAYKAIMEATGLRGSRDKDKLHSDLCGEYFGWHNAGITKVPVRTTTTNERGERDEISTMQALDMYAFVQQFAAEFGIFVPDPDPFWREKAANESAQERAFVPRAAA